MGNLAGVEAMILAGGLGTRLRSMVSDRPKVLAEVLGRPFLAYLLDQLVAAGTQKVILCVGYRGEQIRAAFGDRFTNHHGEIQLTYSQETQLLGTGGALGLAQPLVQSKEVLVMNGDSFCGVDLPGFYDYYQQCQTQWEAIASMVLTEVPDTARYGRVELSPQGRVERFTEKGSNQGAGWINGGIYLLDASLLANMPLDRPISLEADLFPQWLQSG
ncbi:MAG: NTP transferase domain-containing protein, partial [Coleofasciculaceae cyanobacterium SM2_1_6]|nr:NTP transferase domain-containing protein [Coleofasciculaceae cyanobacterium SM2_1_6]